MLGGAWLLISFVLLLAALISRQAPLLLVAALFFLSSAVARLWARYSLRRIEYTRRLSQSRAFFGETVTLEVAISNRKLLPLPWVQVLDDVPSQLKVLKGTMLTSFKPLTAVLANLMSLSWYHRLVRRYPVQCSRRGVFAFGPATIRSGDLFGFFQSEMVDERQDMLLVYPRIVPLEELGIPSRDPFGDLRVRRHLFEDPVRVMTTREYVYGDPLKRVHWKTSARVGRLQSRVYEPTTTVDLALFLDVCTVPPPMQGYVESYFETAVTVVASVADYANREGYSYGLYTNELRRDVDSLVRLSPSSHPGQLLQVMEALAEMRGLFVAAPIGDVVAKEAGTLPWGSTLVVVTAVPSPELVDCLARVRRGGRRVAMIVIGEQVPGAPHDGLLVYHVSDEVYRRQLESLTVGQAKQAGQP